MAVAETTVEASRPLRYRCVECCAPAPSLYKEYTKTSIKLTCCNRCNKNVDPYVERDWALVVLDCILLRLPAYRHVLWNATSYAPLPRMESSTTNFLDGVNLRKIFQYSVVASILQAHLHREGLRTEKNAGDLKEYLYCKLVLYSISGLLVQCAVTYFFAKALSSIERAKKMTYLPISLGLILPLTFSLVTALVSVWENTSTVRFLGKLLETVFQFTAILVVGGACGETAFLLGLLARTGTYYLVSKRLALSCLGLTLQDQHCAPL